MPISRPVGLPPGSIVVVPFPYSDRLAEKRRPAVVVSGSKVATAGFVWIAMITSARNPIMFGDLPILDLGPTGLAVSSVVRPVKLACVEPGRILRVIGALHPEEADDVYESLRERLGPL
ncbi:hypothetical protein HPGCJGGD_2175 [Methylobacterium haplocladii]|uniref:mRNA interferase PemK n=2 Tax=Methylobacterium haplocladii TaxID=1176176 RepID=A0A512IV61_9HYPH|nr:hypothetical protein MHA02_39810 [Methylobacterium haplocladii]GJD84299.1 hypothetical protein HPGCJGGD_2175 [Methylobacterium haplocladii]